jgi:glutamate synthase domain-containing protein 2
VWYRESLEAVASVRKKIELSTYMPIPPPRNREFWTKWKITHIRQLSQTGHATNDYLLPDSERTGRALDQLRLKFVSSKNNTPPADLSNINTQVTFARDNNDLKLTAPLYLGDMSFGALSGVPNIAIARAADATGIMAGTGEGGVQKEVAECKRIMVQWASARFGVDIASLLLGQGVVIKIGQGAKPGIGGHLPGVKVTQPISEARRIPIGRDAISPAPHHDIYSIEDLGQRILALKEATKKPVFVKVGATNYIPYIASGIARMGASGIIIDGAGAGTGAAPSVIKNNVGIPIELATASVDTVLKREGLRDRFTVIAAGKVSCPEDTLKLIALGADITSLGTGALLALGCLMVHKCHLGACPAVLTNKISEKQPKVLSLNQSVVWLTNLVHGWTEELKILLEMMGLSDVRQLVGNREYLTHDRSMNAETMDILGIADSPIEDLGISGPLGLSGNAWTAARVNMLREMAGTVGKAPGEAEISSMGSVSAPFVEAPSRICDWLVSDGAQVTRPSIDPYREEIEIFSYIPRTGLRLAAPFFFTHLPESTPSNVKTVFARTAVSMGLLFDLGEKHDDSCSKYYERVISNGDNSGVKAISIVQLQNYDVLSSKTLVLRIPSSHRALDWAKSSIRELDHSISGMIVDEDQPDSDMPLETSVSQLDRTMKSEGRRPGMAILAESNSIRGADDIFKLVALGADSVGLGTAALTAIGFEESDKEVVFDASKSITHLENFALGVQKEIKLLAGAAGVSSLSSSLVGNRELLRSINLSPSVRRELGVKPAGAA